MDDARTRPTTVGMRRMLVLASVLVFLIGIPLYLRPEFTEINFAWTIDVALTAAFLGAAYWSSFCLEFLCSRETVWANARIAVPAVFSFTALTLVVTLIHLDRFHLGSQYGALTRTITWGWLIVYAVVPFVLGWLWLKQRRAAGGDPPRTAPSPLWFRATFLVLGTLMLVVGVLLLIAPTAVAPAVWAWPLTALTGRAVGAWLVGLGIAAIQIHVEADFRRVRGSLWAVMLLSVLEGVALLRYASAVQADDPRLWVLLLYLVLFFALGLYGVAAQRRAVPSSDAPE